MYTKNRNYSTVTGTLFPRFTYITRSADESPLVEVETEIDSVAIIDPTRQEIVIDVDTIARVELGTRNDETMQDIPFAL